MTMGPLLLALVFYFITPTTTTKDLEGDIFIYIFPMLALMGLFASTFIFRIVTKDIDRKDSLLSKLATYQSASLIRYACIEGPALINLVWFSTTGNLLYLTVAGALILFLFVQRPTKLRADRELKLKGAHKRQFDRMDDPIPES